MIGVKTTSFFHQTPRNFQSLLVHGIECMLAPILRSGVRNDLPRFLPGLCNRVPKCDVIENEICEIMGFVKLF